MQLRCVSTYQNTARGLVYFEGVAFEATDEIAAFLLSDSPASFEVVGADSDEGDESEDGPETRDLDSPPVDRAVRRAGRRKAVDEA